MPGEEKEKQVNESEKDGQVKTGQVAEKDEIVGGEAEPQDIDIELDAPVEGEKKKEEVAKGGEEEAGGQERAHEKKKRKGNSAQERIAKMAREREDAIRYAYEREQSEARMVEENKQLRNQLLTSEEKGKMAQAAAVNSYEESATSRLAAAKKEYKAALDAGDTEKAADLQIDIAKAAAALDRAQQYKIDHKAAPAESKKQEQPRQEQPRKADGGEITNPAAKKWVEKNPWIDKQNEDFDYEKAVDTLTYAENLAAELGEQGKGALVGTKRYYDMLDEYIKDNYEEGADEAEGDSGPEFTKGGTPVAAQSRNSGSSQQSSGTGSKIKIKLSPEEQEVALAVGETQAGRNPDGTKKSRDELLRMYAVNKSTDQQRHSARDTEINRRRGA